ncbi:hypothetical protein GF314_08870 [bacterium]|nr:hypothetical protein [bacterium]
MNLVLARIDDRLIHGQVTVGWGRQLRPDHILLASDEVAADAWQTRVYAMSVPPEMKVSVLPIEAAARALREPDGALEDQRVLLLVGAVLDMVALVELGAPIEAINLGGMHYARGKRELLPEVYVDREDVMALRALRDRGHQLLAQAVPGGRETWLEPELLAEMESQL